MPGANYTYPQGGGYNLTTDIGGGGGGGSNIDLDFFRNMAARKAAQADEDRARRIRIEDEAIARSTAPREGPSGFGIDAQLDFSNKRAQIMKNNAATQGPMLDPMIMIGNTGMAYQRDPNKMNAFQREMYLPGNSGLAGDINASSFDRRDAFERGVEDRKRQLQQQEPDTRADFYGLLSRGR